MAFFNPQLGLTIIPVNTISSSRIVTLPPASTTQGTYYVIKNLYGSQSTIIISTTGVDSLLRQAVSLTIPYGAWALANDGITNWFSIDSYLNSLSVVNKNSLLPFAPMIVTVGFVGTTLTATWTGSPNAVSYTVSFYAVLAPVSSGGLLLQTALTTNLSYSITASINDLVGNLSVNQTFSFTNAIQTWKVPDLITAVTVTMTGGGGGGGGPASGGGGVGGAGGYLSGALSVTPGVTYTLYIAGGGGGGWVDSGPVAGGFGGGGNTYGTYGNTPGGGGGATYILNGSTLIVAVGGGGGAGYSPYMIGGNGGGQIGGTGGGNMIGTGGTQIGGGTGASGGTGGYLTGQNPVNYYGGGGGGYYGGGAGLGAGGGSDYIGTLTNVTEIQGGGALGGTGSQAGSATKGGNGGNGSITIYGYTQSPTTFTNINYYYATVTANNANGSQTTISSPPVKPILISDQPTGLVLAFANNALTLTWNAVTYATSYNVKFYQTSSPIFISNPIYSRVYLINLTSFSAANMNLVGSAVFYNGQIKLTDAVSNQTSAAWYTRKVSLLNNFTSIFNISFESTQADGVTFVIQNINNTTAVGGGGGFLAWSGIGTKSIAITLKTYDNINAPGDGIFSSEVLINGTTPTGLGASGNLNTLLGLTPRTTWNFTVTVLWDGINLNYTILNIDNRLSYSSNAPYNIPSIVGGNNAYIGFTASTGGATEICYLKSWQYYVNTGTWNTLATVENVTTTNTTATTSLTLTNGLYYTGAVQSVNINGLSALTTYTLPIFAESGPSQPTNVQVYVSGLAIICAWTAPANATTYSVSFYTTSSAGTTTGGTLLETDISSTSLQQTITVLSTSYIGLYYYATVTALNSYGASTAITSSTSVQLVISPFLPTNISISLSGFYAVVTWTASQLYAVTYTVTFYSNTTTATSGGTPYEIDSLISGTTKTATTVSPNRTYIYAIVTAVNASTTSSAPTSTTTILTNFAPTNPSNIVLTVVGISMVISWTASANYATSYTVVFYGNGSTNSTTGGTVLKTDSGIIGTTDTPAVSLINANYYYATVTASSSVSGLNSSTIISSSATQAFLYIQNLTIAVSPATGIATISWTAITSATYTYVLYQASGNNYTSSTVNAYGTTSSASVNINTYAPAYYYFTVIAVVGADSSLLTISSIVQSTYSTTVPAAITGLTFTAVANVATFTWSAFSGSTGYAWTLFQTSNTNFTGTVLSTGTTNSSTTTASYSSLTTGTYYYVAVYSTTATVASGYASSPLVIVPTNPSSLAISITGNQGLVTWATTANTTTYTVIFYQNSTATTSGGTQFETDSTAGLTQTTVALLNNTYYYYATVQAINTYAKSAVITTSATTARTQFVPLSPTNIVLSMSGININASWANIYGTYYTLVLYNNGTTNSNSGGTSIETDNNIATTSQLTTATLINANYYYVTIQAFNTYGQSSIVTSAAYQALLYIQNLAISVSGTTGVASLSWSAISGATYTYVLYAATGNNYTSGAMYAYGTTTSSSLTINTYSAAYYYFTVIATVSGASTILATSSIVQGTYAPLTSPKSITGITLWLDGADPNGNGVLPSNGASITTWTDKSGLGYNGTGSAAATWSSSTKLLSFSGAQTYTTTLNSLIVQQSTFVVVNFSTTGYVDVLAMNSGSGTAGLQMVLTNASQHITTLGGATIVNGTTMATNTNVLYNYTFDANASAYVYNNGTQSGSATGPFGFSGSGTIAIGAYNGTGEIYSGYIGEVIIYNVILSQTNRQTVEGYLAWKWGFQTSLPTNHLYYNSAPGANLIGVTNAYLVTATNVATMTWSAYTGATGYTWILVQSTNTNVYGNVLSTGSVSSSTLSATYTGLTLNNYYIFGVYATTASTPSTYGSSMLTLYNNGVPTGGSISLAAFTTLTGGSVTITGLAMNATGYIFYISTTTSTANAIYTSGLGISTTFTYTGSNQTYNVPSGVTSLTVYLWGAGGGSTVSPAASGTYGGAGAFLTGIMNVTPSTSLTVIVGGGGVNGITSGGQPFGGGGAPASTNFPGGNGQTGNLTTGYSSSGGGRSAIQVTGGTDYVDVGAGGGGRITGTPGGKGGITTGGNGTGVATGGRQTGGGTSANTTYNGSLYQGANGQNDNAAGAGSGYYGGGVGGQDTNGGGGSSLYSNLVSYTGIESSDGFTAPNQSSQFYRTGVGNGGTYAGGGIGGNGLVVISYGSGIATQYTLNQTIAFTVTLAANTAYYAILVPSNSFGSGTAVVSSSQTTPNVPVGGAIVLNSGLSTSGGTVTITAATNATNYTVYISTTTSYLQSVYNFSTTTTGSAVAFSTTLSGSTTYYAVLLPTNANGNGTYSNSAGVTTPAALYSYSGTLTFTPAGATGQNGPTLSQCTTSYSSFGSWVNNTAYFNMTTAGIQQWTVPQTKTYTFDVTGAAGGYGGTTPRRGYGARLQFTISLTQGTVINIIVGQAGPVNTNPNGYYGAGGGGGTFVYTGALRTGTLICAAGGAGGGGALQSYTASGNGNASVNGINGFASSINGQNGLGSTAYNGLPGSGGTGGSGGQAGGGGNTGGQEIGGGTGWLSNGQTNPSLATKMPTGYGTLPVGGTSSYGGITWNGSFGGGGASGQQNGGLNGGAGGGGYSGGGGSGWGSSALGNYAEAGGGGGSFISASASVTTLTDGYQTGNGYVSIT